MKKKHVTKIEIIVLNVIRIGTNCLYTQTRLSDGCSGLMLFFSQRVCQALHRQRSLQLVGTSCTSGVSFAARGYLLLDGSKAW